MGLFRFLKRLFGKPDEGFELPPPAPPTPRAPQFDGQTGRPISQEARDVVAEAMRRVAPPSPAPRAPQPVSTTLKLDVAQFTPLKGDAVRAAAEALGPNRMATA